MHVFKAGGTSVGDWLDGHYAQPGVPANAPDFLARRDHYLDARLVRGHLYLRDALPAEGRVIFTLLRRPEAQVMSALWHLTASAGRKPQRFRGEVDLAPAAREIAARQVGFQCCFLELAAGDPDTALDGLSRLHAVGLTERLPDSLRLFAWRLGLPAPRDLPHARDSGAGAADVPAEIEAIMADSLAADRTLYRAAEERFARDYAALCAAARGEDRIDAYLDRRAWPYRLQRMVARSMAGPPRRQVGSAS